ncbi:unnamed protein product [Kluyveromyces dobzhanskii CBS 2104]|uniref:Mediator of RNA polymerase II transcription subunit 20 n=1 Tax=Kluyveromyces dobzhanskii CBS 2104 TaxID=1427455 RepID=A0A0A8L4P5_9SACH|nr:unnamed protein product [Kluyveromyces dobzhanskii CBS 2104]
MGDKWSFELKTFRTSAKNTNPQDTKVMHTLQLSHKNNETVTIKNQSAIITPTYVPKGLYDNDCVFGTPEPFDYMLSNKLSNIWTQRQSIKGEFGVSYQTADLLIRVNNAFSYSGFQGLILDLESKPSDTLEMFQKNVDRIRSMLKEIGLTDVKVSLDDSQKVEEKGSSLFGLAAHYLKVLG